MKEKEEYERYVIKDRKTLREVLAYEKKQYMEYLYSTKKKYWMGVFREEVTINIMKWQKLSRLTDYHDYQYHHGGSICHLVMYMWYNRRKNIMGNKYGLEIFTEHIDKGLMIYHYNNVVNGHAVIGKNCHIHGMNVIGNGGQGKPKCPVLGNNVMLGAGAKVIGDIKIADNVVIAAGAVVVHSFEETGIVVAGIPAKKIK